MIPKPEMAFVKVVGNRLVLAVLVLGGARVLANAEGGGRAQLAHADGAASAVVVHQHANGEGHCMHHLRHRSEPPATHADFLLFPLISDGHIDASTEQAVLHVAARGGAA